MTVRTATRRHEIATRPVPTGWLASCSCRWAAPVRFDVDDADFDGCDHLARMLLARHGRRPGSGMWRWLLSHPAEISDVAGGELAAVVDVVARHHRCRALRSAARKGA